MREEVLFVGVWIAAYILKDQVIVLVLVVVNRYQQQQQTLATATLASSHPIVTQESYRYIIYS